jgi:hypothetical protein
MLPGFPGANIKESWITILSEANSRMVQNSFQRAKGNLGNRTHSTEVKGQEFSLKIKETLGDSIP